MIRFRRAHAGGARGGTGVCVYCVRTLPAPWPGASSLRGREKSACCLNTHLWCLSGQPGLRQESVTRHCHYCYSLVSSSQVWPSGALRGGSVLPMGPPLCLPFVAPKDTPGSLAPSGPELWNQRFLQGALMPLAGEGSSELRSGLRVGSTPTWALRCLRPELRTCFHTHLCPGLRPPAWPCVSTPISVLQS